MLELSEEQIAFLSAELEKSGLTYMPLEKELLDHLCCDLEEKMNEGMDFFRAFDFVKRSMGKDRVLQIQEETLILVNQKYRMMKRFMYVLGTVAPAMVVTGTILKILHWPASGIMLTAGLLLLGLIYLPVFVSIKIRDTRKEGKSVNKPVYFLGMVSGMIFILGALFKIMHWPGASIMALISAIITVAVFLPLLVLNALRDKENQVQSFTILIFVLSFVAIIFMSFALRVSKDIVSAFELAIEDNNRKTELLAKYNDKIGNSLISADSIQFEKDYLRELERRTDDLVSHIDDLMKRIILKASEKNSDAIDVNGEIIYSKVIKKDHMDAPAVMMLGLEGEHREGDILLDMLKDFKHFAGEILDEAVIDKALDTSDKLRDDGFTTSWLSYNFEHLPLMSVLCQLSSIQLDCRLLESAMLFEMERMQVPVAD